MNRDFDPNFDYTRYFGTRRPLWFNRQSGAWRHQLLKRLVREGASCFWLSLVSVLPTDQGLNEAIAHHERSPEGITAGKTFEDALEACLDYDWHISIVQIGLIDQDRRWGIVRAFRHPECEKAGLSIVLVEHDDHGRPRPHWCAATAWRRRCTVPVTLADLEHIEPVEEVVEPLELQLADVAELQALLDAPDYHGDLPEEQLAEWLHGFRQIDQAVDHPEPLVLERIPSGEWIAAGNDVPDLGHLLDAAQHEFDALRLSQNVQLPAIYTAQAAGLVGLLTGGPATPAWVFGNQHLAVPQHHPLQDVYAITGVHPPPAPSAGINLGSAVRYFYRLPDDEPLQYVGDLSVVEGAPGAFSRGIARMTAGGMMAWELRPDVVPHMRVRSGHVVYVRLGEVHALDQRLLETGDYNPDVFGDLHTDTGRFALTRPELVIRSDGVNFLFFLLSRRSSTKIALMTRFVPFVLSRVTSVSFRGVNVIRHRHPEKAFPTRSAWLRAQYALVAEQAPKELVGVINDQRNQALAALERGELSPDHDPVLQVAVLHEQRKRITRIMRVVGQAGPFSHRIA